MKGPVVGWTTAVVLLWVVLAALAAEDCSEGSILCFDFGAVLTLLALPALGVWLVEQYRHPVGARFWEFPQGAWEGVDGADPESLARGELAEETGLRAASMEHLGRLHFDSMLYEPRELAILIDRWGPDRVLLGTDYPYDMGEDDPVGLICSVEGLSDAELSLILGGNAARLLNLEG